MFDVPAAAAAAEEEDQGLDSMGRKSGFSEPRNNKAAAERIMGLYDHDDSITAHAGGCAKSQIEEKKDGSRRC